MSERERGGEEERKGGREGEKEGIVNTFYFILIGSVVFDIMFINRKDLMNKS